MSSLYGIDPAALDVARSVNGVGVRPLASEDRTEWDRLWTLYLQFYRTSLPAIQYEITFRRLLDPAEPMFGYIADHKGASHGLVHIVLHRSAWLDGPSCYLQDLYVDSAVRGTGLGRALIEHVYHVVKGFAGSRVYWLTQSDNTTARHLYDRLADNRGFIQYVKAL
jgi:GNAT superfamily N-acetyltransferase